MNVGELPMILFTVIAQMCVGTFIVLGAVRLVARVRHDKASVNRLIEPVVYAIGPAMVLGLAVSMFHMNNIINTLNVFRHVGSSWLSREIIFGTSFAALGFVFALLQWFRIGSSQLRHAVAGVTAVLGIGLVWSMSEIYRTLVTVPAWNTPVVPIHFFATTIMLGALATSTTLLITDLVRRKREAADAVAVTTDAQKGPEKSGSGALATMVRRRVSEIHAPVTSQEAQLTVGTVQWLSVVTAAVGIVVLISYPMHLGALAAEGSQAAAASTKVFSGGLFVLRLVLLGVATLVLSIFVFRSAEKTVLERSRLLTILLVSAFTLAVAGELIGRYLHYESMFAIGI